MANVGDAIVYTVPDKQLAETARTPPGGGKPTTLSGSIHHQELASFAGLVGRVYPNGKADLIIFPPHKAPVWIDAVAEGDGPGKFLSGAAAAFSAGRKPQA